ncbi:MFS transporter [Pontibacter sp. G13]|uniref:MFS transporter n=1 Tax=Pontibacter sp. G13 TaxID=3074898 RepID=UPI00288A82E9|nr:MFS transporter [Pontibacter sp. G13]WNJ20208.1 MFS transporter [Pontibacter sp. G13]
MKPSSTHAPHPSHQVAPWIMPTIVLAQFCCSALWFAGNAVMGDLIQQFGLPADSLGYLTSAVQVGFISGTLIFAVLTLADRFSPSKVFLVCGIAGGLLNLMPILEGNTLWTLFLSRMLMGISLAGIYPVGMKIASDYAQQGLGKWLGFLVGALVLGTAFPHALKAFSSVVSLPWKSVLMAASGLSILGAAMIGFWVPDGPARKASTGFDPKAIFTVFRKASFRQAAFGYFGHMWELYAFWAFLPIWLGHWAEAHDWVEFPVSTWAFLIIAIGGIGCVLGGYLSLSRGPKRVASWAILVSGLLCLSSPLLFQLPSWVFLPLLLLWGIAVITDSPLFSTLVAHNSPVETKGTALTIVNSLGFALTIVSIQLLAFLQNRIPAEFLYLPLAIGPIIGWWILRKEYQGAEK